MQAIQKIMTSDGLQLMGISFGNIAGSTCYIFIHGLTGSMWGRADLAQSLVLQKSTNSALIFNNRGSGVVNNFKGIDPATGEKIVRTIGGANEEFTECIIDISAAIDWAINEGVAKIVLVGHSTGCNKIMHYLHHGAKHSPDIIAKAVLLCPMSDCYDIIKNTDPAQLQQITDNLLQNKYRDGEYINFLYSIWKPSRLLSLMQYDSIEQCFSYSDRLSTTKLFRDTLLKLEIVLAGSDESADRDIAEIAKWFKLNIKQCDTLTLIPGASHSLKESEEEVLKVLLA